MANPRSQYLRLALPLLEACSPRPTSTRTDWRLTIVGPTREELAQHSPKLAGSLRDDAYDAVIPVYAGMSLSRLLVSTSEHYLNEQYYEFTNRGPASGHPPLTLVAIPPDAGLVIEPSLGLSSEARCALASADPGLAFLSTKLNRIGGQDSLWIAPTEALSGHGTLALRRQIWAFRQESRPWSTADIAHAVIGRGADEEILRGTARARALAAWIEAELAALRIGDLVVHHVWSIAEADDVGTPSLSIVGVGSSDIGGDAVHTRRLNSDWSRVLLTESLFVRELEEIAIGEGARGEDDAFVPLREFMSSADWSAADREMIGLTRLAEGLGYPLRRLAEVGVVGEEVRSADRRGRLWVQSTGAGAGEVFVQQPTTLEGWIEVRSDDPDLLARVLRHPMLQLELRCRSFGSMRKPIVTADTLGSLRIPWPSSAEREQWRTELGRIERVADELDFCADQLQDVAANARGDIQRYAPWAAGPDAQRVCEIASEIRALVGAQESDVATPVGGQAQNWPAPLDILRRRRDSESSPQVRMSHTFDFAEVVIRYDCAILLALLGVSDVSKRTDILRRAGGVGQSDWKLGLGHWRAIQRDSRRALAASVDESKWPCPEHRDLAARVCLGNLRKLEAADEVVKLRNQHKGHGFTLPPWQSEEIDRRVDAAIKQILDELTYIPRHLMYQLNGVEKRRDRTVIDRLVLAHDNPEFQRQRFERKPGSPYEQRVIGEVYLDLQNDEALCIWPWVRIVPSATGAPSFGMLDGRRGKRGVWMLPIDGGKSEPDDRCDFQDAIGSPM